MIALVWAWVLALLGFSSCDKIGGSIFGRGGEVTCEYGCPYTEFVLKGVVTDADSNPIKGIKVTLVRSDDEYQYNRIGDQYTDENGSISLEDACSTVGAFYSDKGYRLCFEDVDGEQNGGEFESKSIDATIVKTKDASGAWFEGAYKCEFETQLSKK